MNERAIGGWVAVALMFVSASSVLAHHSLARFDTTRAVSLKGVIVRFEQVNPHSFLYVDSTGADGQVQRWALEGPPPRQLIRMGVKKEWFETREGFRVGDVIEACGYAVKDGVEPNRTISTEPISQSLKATTPKTMTGRILATEMLVTRDGEKLPWEDYGHHLCLGPDYVDHHAR